MHQEEFIQLFKEHLLFTPTTDQQSLIEKLYSFLFVPQNSPVFILKGYAGTGKTTMMGTLVKILPELNLDFSLLAPTGRAAKVLSAFSGESAFTIHKKIYYKKVTGNGFSVFTLAPNKQKNTVYIVDEASMIAYSPLDSAYFGQKNLLEDLLNYVFSGTNSRLLIVGDTAQLPPVQLPLSPALDVDFMQKYRRLTIDSIELKEVVRQEQKSGVLFNATQLRNQITQEKTDEFPNLKVKNFPDIKRVNGVGLQEVLEEAFNKYGDEEVMVVTRSNKAANLYNGQIRTRIKWQEDEIAAGDLLMVVKNNYYFCKEEKKISFIANGDTAEIQKIIRYEEMYGFRFADALIQLTDYPDLPPVEVKLMLDTIMLDTPNLPRERMKELYYAVAEDFPDELNKKALQEKILSNPYFNALQIKFAYAVTCHKAQGGQWAAVFIDQGYLTEEMLNKEFYRWLYTAFTRATKELYLVSFSKEFFK